MTTTINKNNNNGFKPRPKKDTKPGDPKNDNTKKKFIRITKDLEVVIDGKKGNLGVQMEDYKNPPALPGWKHQANSTHSRAR